MIYLIIARIFASRQHGLYSGLVESSDPLAADIAASRELDRLFGRMYTIERHVEVAPKNAHTSFGDAIPVVRNGAVMFMPYEDK
jgi:hypothetical protein